ncbi:TPA: hypothetical protein SBV85_001314 [Campylobacter coli]|nr:hypothetical protein [Campylobacter coli]
MLKFFKNKEVCVMGLIKKGERNLEIAKILDTQEFLKMSNLQKEHLCSTIINRLYYGVYLIGKGKLLQKDSTLKEEDFLGHGTLNQINNQNLNPNSKHLWIRLMQYYPKAICVRGVKLKEIREMYDYRSDDMNKALQDLQSAKNIAQYLAKQL